MKALKIDMILLSGVLALVGMGIVILYSSSAAYAVARNLPESFYLMHHIQKVILGSCAMLLGLSVNYRFWEKAARPLMFLSLLLLLFLITSSLVGRVNGARRWVGFASFGLQPSELAKISMVFFLARYLVEKQELMSDFRKGFLASLVVAAITFLLILKQPNYSTAATILAISIAMVFVGGCRISHLLSLALIGLPALGILMVSSPYRMKRVMAFLHPEANPISSYQSMQALISLGNGGFTGTGLGTSTQKLGYLPMPFTDTIFSVLGEELGWLGTTFCLTLFALVVWRGLRVSFYCADRFGSLAALGITISLAVNVIMHIGVCAKFFPTTGQPLPFVSYGGTSLCTVLFSMGILLNISGNTSEYIPALWKKNVQRGQLLSGPSSWVGAKVSARRRVVA